MILVSIVSITYNHAAYIRQCLDGFLMQKCDFRFEVLIHDDASTDGTSDIIREYERKYPEIIKPIIQTENQYSKGGRGVNMRFNFPRAKGKYIAICEGDDFWTDPLKLQKQVDFLENHPDYVLTFHNVKVIDANNKIIIEDRLRLASEKSFSDTDINKIFIPTLSLVFRNGLIDHNKFPKVFNGDAYILGILSCYGKARYHNFFGANYRMHSGGIYTGNSVIKNHLDSLRTRRILINELPSRLRKSVRERCNFFYTALLSEYWLIKDYKKFIRISFKYFLNNIKVNNLKGFFSFYYRFFFKNDNR